MATSARATVEGMLRATAVAFTRRQRPRGCMIVLAAPQIEGANPAVCDELKRRRAENIEILERRLEQAVADGELPGNCTLSGRPWGCGCHGLCAQQRVGRHCPPRRAGRVHQRARLACPRPGGGARYSATRTARAGWCSCISRISRQATPFTSPGISLPFGIRETCWCAIRC